MMQKQLWNAYYSGDRQVFYPSDFAKSVLPRLSIGSSLLDVGCGNGRDSIFFYRNGIKVDAIDASERAIALLRKNEPHIDAICGDALTNTVFANSAYDNIYSRFFLHTVTADEEAEALRRCCDALRPSGGLFLEARSIEDELCGVGERVSDNEWLEAGRHYRRFIVPEQLEKMLTTVGFSNISMQISRGFAPYGDQNPIVLRAVALK